MSVDENRSQRQYLKRGYIPLRKNPNNLKSTIFIAHNYSHNSFSSMSKTLAEYLLKRGCRVIFISYRPYFTSPAYIETEHGNILVLSWPTKRRPASLREWLWFIKLYLKYKPAFTIGHFAGSNIVTTASKILSRGKTKTITYYHTLSSQIVLDSPESKLSSFFKKTRKKMFFRLFADVIVCPSQLAREDLEKVYSSQKGKVILNPMQDRYSDKKHPDTSSTIVSYLGRLDRAKGIFELIEAFTLFRNKYPNSNMTLRLAGAGQIGEEIQKITQNMEQILFVGHLAYRQVDDYISGSHFMIIPSIVDNLPTVGLEALMHQTPLLLSNTTGLSKYLKMVADAINSVLISRE